jgi:hypothetical protein
MDGEAKDGEADPAVAPEAQEEVRSPFSGVPLVLAILAVVCGAIALREWWEYVGAAAAGMGLGAGILAAGRRRRNRALAVTGWIVGGASLAFGAMCAFLHIGHVSRDDWPWPLREMVEVAQADAGSVSAQSLGGFIDQDYVWSVPLAPGTLSAVTARFDLSTIPPGDVPAWFPKLFPIWWRPDPGSDAEFFSTPDFPFDDRGSDGDHILAMHDRRTGTLYVYCKNNF